MTTFLRPAAQQLLARLSVPKPDDKEDFFGPYEEPPDISLLSREELGAIWGAVDRAESAFDSHSRSARSTAYAIKREVYEMRHASFLTDAQVLDYLERSEGDGRDWYRVLEALAWRMDRTLPLPALMVQQLRRILGDIKPSLSSTSFCGIAYREDGGKNGLVALCVARHLQPDGGGPEVDELMQVLRQSCAQTHYKRMALELELSLTREELSRHYGPTSDFDYRDDPRYSNLFEDVLRDACARVEVIHRGELPYVGYKAFADGDADLVAAAYRFLVRGNAPWLAGLTHRLLLLVSHAPDMKSKSLPSQTVCCRLAEEIMEHPTPEGIASLEEAAKLAINATVKAVLTKRILQAKAAFALRLDVALDLVASAEPNKKQQTKLATLLQASYGTGLDFSLAHWRDTLCLSSGAGAFTQGLIWLAQPSDADIGLAFMAEPCEGGLRLSDCHGAALQIADGARIRLWHPLPACPEERLAWQRRLTQRQLRQPVAQAFRACYQPLAQELERPPVEEFPYWRVNESRRFADLTLSLQPLLSLARREGWKMSREYCLVRSFGTLQVFFEVGAMLCIGMSGQAPSMSVTFWKGGQNSRPMPVPIKDVPPVLYSEACYAVALLVSAASSPQGAQASIKPESAPSSSQTSAGICAACPRR